MQSLVISHHLGMMKQSPLCALIKAYCIVQEVTCLESKHSIIPKSMGFLNGFLVKYLK